MKRTFFAMSIAIAITGAIIYMVLNFNVDQETADSDKVMIVTTLFPQYEFTKAIGGDKVEVTLLLPPGVESHAYEPKPSDISKINNSAIFVYTGEVMEPWAHNIIESADKKVRVVDASAGIEMIEDGEEHEGKMKHPEHEEVAHHESEEEHHHHNGVDPHIWLDFDNAKKMAANIAEALIAVDPQNTDYYQDNLIAYQNTLIDLDVAYQNNLSECKSRTIIYGGHYAFGYLAKKYGLEHVSAQGFSPDAEPTAKDLIALTEQIRKNDINYIFYEELTSSKIAETLANETNVELLLLNGAHNLSKEDYESGVTFISIMEKNLNNLSLGLGCQK
jgi:zinc transport system substrate-binding protein